MIAVDTNILIYAHRADAPFHDAAVGALREVVEAIPLGYSVALRARVSVEGHAPTHLQPPTPLERALDQIAEWLRSPSCRVIAEPEGYLGILADTLRHSQAVGSKVHDARIAALCLAHGVDELWSADRDFSRFSNLRVRNPLSA